MLAREIRKVNSYASNSTARSSHRGGCPPVAGESLHSHAGNHQVNSERGRGHRRRSMDSECLWTLSFPFPNSRWDVKIGVAPKADVKGNQPRRLNRPTQDTYTTTRQTKSV